MTPHQMLVAGPVFLGLWCDTEGDLIIDLDAVESHLEHCADDREDR